MQTEGLLLIPNSLPLDVILQQLTSFNTSAMYCYKIHLILSSHQYPRSLLHMLQVQTMSHADYKLWISSEGSNIDILPLRLWSFWTFPLSHTQNGV